MRLRAALFVLLAGCTTTPAHVDGGGLHEVEVQVVDGARFTIHHTAADAEVVEEVVAALARAAELTSAWGRLESDVEVRIYPTHEALEAAVGAGGLSWLRAWARYDEILLQSPRTFTLFERGRANLSELLAHELTHCLMYQRVADRDGWREADRTIPIWFREGMASYTARQGHRRMSEAKLADWRVMTTSDPLGDAPGLYRNEPEVVYGAAHWAFAFLAERYGVAAVTGILAEMRRGQPFPDAFEQVVGITLADFEADWLRYLDWGGWADRRRPRVDEVLGVPGRHRIAPASPPS